jgi:hypothetical protein
MARTSARNITARRALGGQGPHDIAALVRSFISTLVSAVEQNTTHRIRTALVSRTGTAGRTGFRRGAPRAKQLCPVPGCKNAAAPVFGMVCAAHKDVAKSKIKQYREARRQAKVAPRPTGTRKKAQPRPAARAG